LYDFERVCSLISETLEREVSESRAEYQNGVVVFPKQRVKHGLTWRV